MRPAAPRYETYHGRWTPEDRENPWTSFDRCQPNGVIMMDADLSGSNLSGADLTEADLTGVVGADLTGVVLE